jgi:hypothetical protein
MEPYMATYNQANMGYNEQSVSYAGTLIINVEGLSNPIILNNINVITRFSQDDSNATTIGVISINYSPIGIVTLENGSYSSASATTVEVGNTQSGMLTLETENYFSASVITLEVGSSQSGQLLNSLGSIRTSGEIIVELI